MTDFKPGDRVRRTSDFEPANGRNGLRVGEEYTVARISSNRGLILEGKNPSYDYSAGQFELVEAAPNADVVNHPPHYTSDPSGVECIEITRHRNFNVGNAIKYLWRAGLKADPTSSPRDKQIEDLRKAVFYVTDEIERLSKEDAR